MHESFNYFLQNGLNPTQLQAVQHESGSILVVAGAGSGKTRVITARITHLIVNKQVSASSIVALTFTNKAAQEMKERIASFLHAHAELPFVGTFHSYCVQILKKYNAFLPTPFVSILDSDDQQKMIHDILHRHGLQKQFTAKSVAHHISQMKNQSLSPSQQSSTYAPHPILNQICNAYESEKKASKCLDFDDLLLETVRLFKNNDMVKKQFQAKIRHVLVDEYQDTNVVQHELLKTIALVDKELALDSVCAVGDADQSIYSWRGATVTNMTEFKHVFPGTTVITIDQNYRSAQPILNLANHAIQNNTQRTPKNLWSEKTGTNRIYHVVCLTEYQEAKAIAQLLLVAKEKYGLNNVGILYRTHTQSRALEEALLKESIPYRIIGGIQFYERKEIKDLIAYLKIIANPFDKTSFFRIINTPTRGLGDKFEQEFYATWTHEPFATWQDIIKQYISSQSLGKVKTAALEKFLSIVQDIQPTDNTSSVLATIITRTDYITYIKNNNDPTDAQARLDNIKELMEAITYFENNGTKSITAFLDEVALMQELMNKQNRDSHAVSLMTLHAAKGLEFSLVILPGFEEGIIPTTRSLNQHDTLEEERRLFYVGITRAKEHLLIIRAKTRYSYGQMVDQLPSRFLREVHSLIPQEDISYNNLTHAHNFFAQWLGTSTKKLSDVIIPTKQNVNYGTKKASSDEPLYFTTQTTTWRKNQPVKHEKYGIGTVQEVENRSAETTYITVRFKTSVKKMLAQFLQRL